MNVCWFGWLVVFYVPSTARSFTVPCDGHEAQLIHRTHRESNHGPSRGSPLLYRCATPALYDERMYKQVFLVRETSNGIAMMRVLILLQQHI